MIVLFQVPWRHCPCSEGNSIIAITEWVSIKLEEISSKQNSRHELSRVTILFYLKVIIIKFLNQLICLLFPSLFWSSLSNSNSLFHCIFSILNFNLLNPFPFSLYMIFSSTHRHLISTERFLILLKYNFFYY